MAQQTQELKTAVGAQEKRIEAIERTMVSNEKKAEEGFAKVESRPDATEKNQSGQHA